MTSVPKVIRNRFQPWRRRSFRPVSPEMAEVHRQNREFYLRWKDPALRPQLVAEIEAEFAAREHPPERSSESETQPSAVDDEGFTPFE